MKTLKFTTRADDKGVHFVITKTSVDGTGTRQVLEIDRAEDLELLITKAYQAYLLISGRVDESDEEFCEDEFVEV